MSEESDFKSSSAKSASEGDLAENEEHSKIPHYTIDNGRSLFNTLPRWISGHKKLKKKTSNVFPPIAINSSISSLMSTCNSNSELSNTNSLKRKNSLKKKHSFKGGNIISKLLRNFTALSLPSISYNISESINKNKFGVLSASNTDLPRMNNGENIFKEQYSSYQPVGIRNHGNTCYLNAIIQCLGNTDVFAEYFLTDQYMIDFIRRNKFHSKKFGTKGELTKQLAVLIKSLWAGNYHPEISSKVKYIIAKYGSQYEGNQQHDAQEFLLWLLDKIHEDLNTATKLHYKRPKSMQGKNDEEVAAETLANHLRCNNSFIHDVFQGQLRSSLQCPQCCRQSNTFDPYLCVSLPIPQPFALATIPFIQLSSPPYQTMLEMDLDQFTSLKGLVSKVALDHNIDMKKMFVTNSDLELQTKLEETNLCIFEASVVPEETLVVVWRNCASSPANVYGPINAVHLESSSSYLQVLYALTLDKDTSSESVPDCRLYIVEAGCYLSNTLEEPLMSELVTKSLCLSSCVCLYVEWPTSLEPSEEEPASDKLTLYNCFDLYFKEEKLSLEDAWMCPNCQRFQQGVKKLNLWSLPDVFIVHLKRFRQVSVTSKLCTPVEFPVYGLDMSTYAVARTSTNNQVLRRHRKFLRSDDSLYDLYAVCNHQGHMSAGHYTAFCKNPVDNQWYLLDDTKVHKLQESELVTSDAYILFYQRSAAHSSCASSTSGYSSASSVEHHP